MKNGNPRKGRIRQHFSINRTFYGGLIILGFVMIDLALFWEQLEEASIVFIFFILMTAFSIWWPAVKSSRFQRQARADAIEAGED